MSKDDNEEIGQVAGELVSERRSRTNNGESIAYHWEVRDGSQEAKHIFLHVSYSLQESQKNGQFIVARDNFDSPDVRGQGKPLWKFLTEKLQATSNAGILNKGAMPLIHCFSPNQYAAPLVQGNDRYTKKGNEYFGLYEPEVVPLREY